MQAKESFAADQPAEVRILKHLLTLEGDRDMQAALDDAFAAGSPLQTKESDYLSTCASTPACLSTPFASAEAAAILLQY